MLSTHSLSIPGIAALWGPAHGGANEAVLVMLNEIGDESNIDKFIAKKINGVVYFGCSNSPRPRIQQLKKEQMWIQLLEGLHPEESEVLDLVKDKKLTSKYKITKQNVIDAFPELRLQDESEETQSNKRPAATTSSGT